MIKHLKPYSQEILEQYKEEIKVYEKLCWIREYGKFHNLTSVKLLPYNYSEYLIKLENC